MGVTQVETNNANSTEQFIPNLRSACFTDKGSREYMEDDYICVDDLSLYLSSPSPSPVGFYGLFDGHSGVKAANYAQQNMLNIILQDENFPHDVDKAVANSFTRTDDEMLHAGIVSSGTTALAGFVWGNTLVVANAGDCRAVLGRRGKAIDVSTDHKPTDAAEKLRIESLGGTVDDTGYVNGTLAVSRALGDWQLKLEWGHRNLVSSEAEVKKIHLTEQDEFLVMATDGLWDVVTSEVAEKIVRRELIRHNDPAKCCEALVKEALNKNSSDNITAVVVCFSDSPPPNKQFRHSMLRKDNARHVLNTNATKDFNNVLPPLLGYSPQIAAPKENKSSEASSIHEGKGAYPKDLNNVQPPPSGYSPEIAAPKENKSSEASSVHEGKGANPKDFNNVLPPLLGYSPEIAAPMENKNSKASSVHEGKVANQKRNKKKKWSPLIPKFLFGLPGLPRQRDLSTPSLHSDFFALPDERNAWTPSLHSDFFALPGEKNASTPSLHSDFFALPDERNASTPSLHSDFFALPDDGKSADENKGSSRSRSQGRFSNYLAKIKECFKFGYLKPLGLLGGLTGLAVVALYVLKRARK